MSPYDAPRFYDIAWGWRDVPAECEFLLGRFQAAQGRLPRRALEVACGPGEHVRTLAARGVASVGLDLASSMMDYAKVQPGGDDPDVRWLVADMRDFALDLPVELAFCLVDSLSHLLTLDDLLTHLETMARNVVLGGLYVLDQSHPRDAFAQSTPGMEPEWEMESEDGEILVHTTWGEPGDPFDFTTQIGQLTVTLVAVREGEEIFRERSVLPSRLWLAGELEAAVRASGTWRLRERFGALDATIPWASELPAYRMVTVLERVGLGEGK